MAGRKFDFKAKETTVKEEEKKATEKKVEKEPEKKAENTEKGRVGNLAEKLNDTVPNAFKFQFIPRNKLKFFEENDYPQEDIESLADKILHMGLIHNLETFYLLDEDIYIIDSGERRCHAIDMLIEKYKDSKDTDSPDYEDYVKNVKMFENGYPCKVKHSIGNEELDELDLKIRHYVANEEVRNKDKDPVKTAERIRELNKLYALRNQMTGGEKVKNINKKIAEDMGISDRQVKNYKALDKLIPELQELFKEKKLNLTDGSNYAQLTVDEQKQLYNLIENGEDKKQIKKLYENIQSLKKDMADKENEIENLETEKKEALKEIEKAKQAVVDLQEQLEKESHKEAPDTEAVKKLQAEIDAANKGLEVQKKNHKTAIKMKDEMIADLKKQLETKEQLSTGTIPTGYEQLMKLNLKIEMFQKTVEELKSALTNYQEIYTEEEPIDKSPEDFKTEIRNLLKKSSDLLK